LVNFSSTESIKNKLAVKFKEANEFGYYFTTTFTIYNFIFEAYISYEESTTNTHSENNKHFREEFGTAEIIKEMKWNLKKWEYTEEKIKEILKVEHDNKYGIWKIF